MQQKTISAGFIPLYLKLYEETDPGYYKKYDSFINNFENLITNGIVFDTQHVEETEKLFVEEDVSFIVLLYLCYSPSLLIADFIERQNLPVLIIDSTPTNSLENMSSEYLIQNHGIHGVMDLTSVLKSRGVDYTVVAGYMENMSFRKRLKETIFAFSGAVLFKNQKIGITGKSFIEMGNFSIDFNLLIGRRQKSTAMAVDE